MAASQTDRTRAYQLRSALKKGEEISDEDREWLGSYETTAMRSSGASAASRVVHVEESSMAVGTGDAAEAAAAGAIARQEGLRLDYATTNAIQGMSRACEMYEKMCTQMMKQNQQMVEVQVSMLEAFRDAHIARTYAEADLITQQAEAEAENKGDPIMEALTPMIAPLAGALVSRMAAGKKKKDMDDG